MKDNRGGREASKREQKKGTAGNIDQSEQEPWKVSELLATSLLDASIDSMAALDQALCIQVWNKAAAEWSAKPAEAVLYRHFFDVFPEARQTPGLQEGFQQALQGRKVFLPASNAFYLEGHFECHLTPVKSQEGKVCGVLQVIHDVAHRVKREKELQQLNSSIARKNAALQHANEEMATFAKIASHDLKEPLRRIYAFAELITMHEAGRLSNNGKANLRRIQKSLHRMALLTDDMANFAELNLAVEAPDSVNLTEITNEVRASLSAEIDQSNATLIIAGLPLLTGYRSALHQMIRQLVDNALKFRQPEVPPVVRVSCTEVPGAAIAHTEADPFADYYCLSIQDNGIGFDPGYSTRIFKMFERLAPDGNYKGSGMGLALAQKAAHLHEGFIIAESCPGKGSTFHCYLMRHLHPAP